MAEKILPLPVKRNKFGVRVADLTTTEYYRQIEEEVLEAHEAAVLADAADFYDEEEKFDDWTEAAELVDIIATCITRLEILGYNASEREELYAACNDKNAKRGYFDEG